MKKYRVKGSDTYLTYEEGSATITGKDEHGFWDKWNSLNRLPDWSIPSDPWVMTWRLPTDEYDFVEVVHAHACHVGVELEQIQ